MIFSKPGNMASLLWDVKSVHSSPCRRTTDRTILYRQGGFQGLKLGQNRQEMQPFNRLGRKQAITEAIQILKGFFEYLLQDIWM
ncbi:hypothetical protein DESC_830061 [Desulfosarcina cetonica]|nr:hypothetical protein DESC_830061 [Desulfosarcina cetonica]